MAKRFIITHIGDDGETILADAAEADEVFPIIVADALESDILPDHDHETREAAVEMVARIKHFEGPRESVEGVIYGRTYRVEEIPDDPAALDEFIRTLRFYRGPSPLSARLSLSSLALPK